MLPENIPSSFQYKNERGENYQIKYFLKAYLQDMESSDLSSEKEIVVL
jgi:hypothetical protein